jgi:hypothetical protein
MQFDLDSGMAVLSRTPTVLDALLRDLPAAWVGATDGPDTWSPYDVMGHLIHGEETDWIPRARIVLAEGEHQSFEPFDRFAQMEKSKGRTLHHLLDEFRRLRGENLVTLASWTLSPSDLERRGRHPELGIVTMRQLLATWVAHDLSHIGQIVRVMARQYAEAVGPWAAYMSVFRA